MYMPASFKDSQEIDAGEISFSGNQELILHILQILKVHVPALCIADV